jgi:glycosyltransferase involved in cell wall biosynthesis
LQKASSLVQKAVLDSAQVKNYPLVSVVITTKNEEKNIENCLRSINGQTFTNVELIVVDNFSEDETVEIAKKYTTKVYFKGPERSSQRNYGVQVAKKELELIERLANENKRSA